jgi:hypothetical protein
MKCRAKREMKDAKAITMKKVKADTAVVRITREAGYLRVDIQPFCCWSYIMAFV